MFKIATWLKLYGLTTLSDIKMDWNICAQKHY